jgi:hypothetical protein
MGFSLSVLSICPRVAKQRGRLIASSAWRFRVLTLGLLQRQVIVDPKEQVVIIRRRVGWFFRQMRRIRFSWIKAIGYGYSDVSGNSTWTVWGTYKTADNFTVQLKLHGGDDVHLFYFYGEGPLNNAGPLPDWFYWDDYLLDLSGTQAQESRTFVELLSRMTGAPIEPLSL